MARWLSRYRWMLAHSVRMTAAGIVAFAAAVALGLPEGLSAAVTAIAVTQSNVGGSLQRVFEQFVGSLFGAVFAAGVVLVVLPEDALSKATALAIALAPLSLLAARSAGFRIAPITAAIVLLGGTGLQLGPLSFAVYRILGVGLGCGIGLLISFLVAPARASRSVVEAAGRTARLLAEQLEALASGDSKDGADLPIKAIEIRENLVRLEAMVEEAAHERRAWLADAPDGERLLRTLRRVRHDVNMIRRAAREAGSDALQDCAAASWRVAAESGASTLRGISRVLAGQDVPEDFDTLTAAVRDYRAAVDDMRQTGVAHSLSTTALSRLFGIGFALDQLRRDLADLAEAAGAPSAPPKTPAAQPPSGSPAAS